MSATQLQFPIFDPSEPRVMPQTPAAFFTINRMVGSSLRQSIYPLRRLAELVPACAGATDTYMSQGIFATPRRRVVNLAYATHAAIDLDTYRDSDLARLSSAGMVRELLNQCEGDGIPAPSIILASGRGYYAKWFWSTPVPRAEAGRATAVNRNLVRRLTRFRADPAAVDLARVMRIRGTINSKSGRPVEIVHLAGTQDAPLTYNFDTLATAVLPAASEQPPAIARPRVFRPPPGRFTREGWHWTVLEDLRRLASLRYPDGLVRPGERAIFGHLAACQLARVVNPAVLAREVRAIAATFLPADYVDNELQQHCSTLLERARASVRGELVYRYSKATMVELLQITPAEERVMSALISDEEKLRRHRESDRRRRRDAGMTERAAYEANAVARRGRVVEMRSRGLTWRAIAAELEISVSEARRLIA